MCLSHNWYNLFGYCVLYGTWILDGCVDCIICTTNWLIQISLDFRKWLIYKDLILKDTKLLSKLPWTSRKQSTIFISSKSFLVSTFSILSANTEPLVCVVFVLWKELNRCFLYFFLNSLFYAMLGILSTPLFLWLKSTARCTLSNTCPLFTITFPLNRYLNSVYRQSTCWWVKQNEFNFFSSSWTFPSSTIWYLQAGKKHVFLLWWAMQWSLQTIYFSYVVAEMERLSSETFA